MIDFTTDFSQLTEFVNNEFQKMREVYGVENFSAKMLNKITGSIWAHYKMLSNLDKKKVKFMIKVEWAKFTMPHNWLWKIFHSRIWKKVKEELEKEKNAPQEEPVEDVSVSEDLSLVPKPTVPVDLNALSYPNQIERN